jgi:hypothetical protein
MESTNPKIFLSKKTKREKEELCYNKETKGRWTNTEHHKFIQACLKYGCDWKKVKTQ